ncbi:response regulator [Kamptonema cortianum]|jgi:two-component system phosphate regulon response regulator OmpR|nr:response regulator [Geitlerinema splendidum]MDK3157740.1 response regulator [Kamptonema cortianum]
MTVTKPHLLLVDDDERLRELLFKFLVDKGFFVSTARDAVHARELMDTFIFDLMILDVMMPDEDGLSLTDSIRNGPARMKDVPILLLTAMGETEDRITGLGKGADDYLCKPFDPRELLLRLQAILKRSQSSNEASVLSLGKVSFDIKLNRLEKEGTSIPLTTVESSLLKIFARHRGKPLSREDLASEYGGDMNPRTIDVQINRLRKKIEDDLKIPRYLQTVRGKGYILLPDA